MKSNIKLHLGFILNTLLIISCASCIAEATEQHSKSSQHDGIDDDAVSFQVGSNVPDTNYSSYSTTETDSTNKTRFTCVIKAPYEIHRYELKCDRAKYLDVTVSDCCISGDMWQAKLKAWDKKPNTAIAITPSIANQKSSAARIYNYGGTDNSPEKITALLECSYKSGVNVFPAAAIFTTESDGICTMKDLGSDIKM